MDRLQEYYKESLLSGLCGEYKSAWQRCHNDKEKLMSLALRRQSIPHLVTFAQQGKGLTKDYLKKEFKDYINGSKVFIDVDGVRGDYTSAMYVGWDYDNPIDISSDTCVLMWCRDVVAEIQETKCPSIYIANDSDVTLSLRGFNSPSIYLFDNSRITIEDGDEESNVLVYKYSKDAQVEAGKYYLGKFKSFDKELRL